MLRDALAYLLRARVGNLCNAPALRPPHIRPAAECKQSQGHCKAPRLARTLPKVRQTTIAGHAMASNDSLDDLITAAADALALPIDPAWKPAVRTHLEITLRLGKLVEEFDLPDDAEPAPVFRA